MKKPPIGEILISKGYATPKQLKEALIKQKSYPRTLLGDILVLMRYISSDQLKHAVSIQNELAQQPAENNQQQAFPQPSHQASPQGDAGGKVAGKLDLLIELLIKKDLISMDELANLADENAKK